MRTCLAGVMMLLTVPGQADDWTQFRGPGRDGVWSESGPFPAFPAGGPPIRWRAPVGPSFASPVIAQGRVFVEDVELKQPLAKERLLCFEETTGRLLWTYAYDVTYEDWAFNPENGGGPTATPVVEAGKVYMMGGNGYAHCLDTLTGKLVWENDLGKTYKVRSLQCRPSPLIEGDTVVFVTGASPGACVVALNKTSGKEVWKALNEPPLNSSPIVITAAHQRQLIVWTGESVTSLNPATGDTLWREWLVTSTNDGTSTPVVDGDLLLIGGLMLQLNADKPGATILWPDTKAVAKRVLSVTSTAMLRDGCVYSCQGKDELVCLEEKTGRQRWVVNNLTGPKRGPSIHLTPAGDVVFLFTDEGNLISAKLTPTAYQEISRAHLIDPTTPFEGLNRAYAVPAFANGHIFVRSTKEVVCASLVAKP